MKPLRRGPSPRGLLLPWLALALLLPLTVAPATADAPGSPGHSDINGAWSGTWTRHDTRGTGGFTLVVGEREGRPYATFLGQEAISVSTSPGSVKMTLEPASECGGAHLRFSFVDGQPVSGDYSTYGECTRTGTYTFEGTPLADAARAACPPYEPRPASSSWVAWS